MLRFGFDGFSLDDLYRPAGLHRLHVRFLVAMRDADPALSARFAQYREGLDLGTPRGGLSGPAESTLLIDVADQISRFVGKLFNLETELEQLRARITGEGQLFEFKREFVSRR